MLFKLVRYLALFFCLFIVLRYSVAIVWGKYDFWTYLSRASMERTLSGKVEALEEKRDLLAKKVALWKAAEVPLDQLETEALKQLHRVPPDMKVLPE